MAQRSEIGFPRAFWAGAVRRFEAFRNTLLLLAALGSWAAASPCHAEEEPPTVFGYALSGLGTGLATGVAVGYLSTGPKWESDEWRKLLWGGGIGALTGLGVGIVFGVVDAGSSRATGPGIGFYVMRDANYGLLAGALTGGIIGALYWAGGNSSKDVLVGLSWGTVIGTGLGLGLGVLEGVLRTRGAGKAAPAPAPAPAPAKSAASLHFDLGFTGIEHGVPLPYPNLSARF